MLLGAAVLFLAIFVCRLLDGQFSSGLTILYVLPVVLVAIELGRRAGVLAGLVAFGLFCAWVPFAPESVPLIAFLSRGLVFVLVGLLAGQLADRLHVALAQAQASARHFALARDMLCTATFDGYMTHLNGSWEETLGWTAEELTSRPFVEFVHPDDRAKTVEEAARLTTGDFTADFTNRYRTKDGEWRWIEWASKADPETRTIVAAARDVTDRRAAEEARLEAEERFRRAFDDSATGMAIVGVEGAERDVLLDANESLARIFATTRAALVGSRALTEHVDPAHAAAVSSGMERLLRGEDTVHRFECQVRRPTGGRIWLHMTASLVRDAEGRPRYRLVQVLDVTDRKRSEDRLRYLADHDPLSGVFNRRRFEQELQRELGHNRRSGVVLLIDVDRFKAINDTLGHAVGDAVIAGLGDVLRERLRTADVVARLGGDEFAVILRRTDMAAAETTARELQDLAAERLAAVVGERFDTVTLSVGLAAISEEVFTPDELLGRADRALYAAKAAGRNHVTAFQGDSLQTT